jgi:4-hydroxybenzoate polyprenyltransferase
MVVIGMFCLQQYLIRDRDPKACFKAFLQNNQVGAAIFFGIFLSYWL